MVKCVVSADDDRKGPAAFSDAGCADQYGEGFGCDCSFEGKNSVCPGPTGCHNMPNPDSECIVPDSIYAPCGRPACTKGLLTCDMGGRPGSCWGGRCVCGADGRASLTSGSDPDWSPCLAGVVIP